MARPVTLSNRRPRCKRHHGPSENTSGPRRSLQIGGKRGRRCARVFSKSDRPAAWEPGKAVHRGARKGRRVRRARWGNGWGNGEGGCGKAAGPCGGTPSRSRNLGEHGAETRPTKLVEAERHPRAGRGSQDLPDDARRVRRGAVPFSSRRATDTATRCTPRRRSRSRHHRRTHHRSGLRGSPSASRGRCSRAGCRLRRRSRSRRRPRWCRR